MGLAPLGGIDDTYSSLAQIAQLFPEFDFPREQLPDTFHYIGSLTADRQLGTDHNFPWDRLDGRPLIFASLGTVIMNEDNLSVFPRILSACAGPRCAARTGPRELVRGRGRKVNA